MGVALRRVAFPMDGEGSAVVVVALRLVAFPMDGEGSGVVGVALRHELPSPWTGRGLESWVSP